MNVQWVFSEAGLEVWQESGAGLGWLRAWLLSIGAKNVCFSMLQDDTWRLTTETKIFFADEKDLHDILVAHKKPSGVNGIVLHNPARIAWHYLYRQAHILLLPLGDILYQRQSWLTPLLPELKTLPELIHVYGHENGDIYLERGFSASLKAINANECLNNNGLLPEEQLLAQLCACQWQVRVAESCTAGGLAERISRVPGASQILKLGWIVYDNQVKEDILAVSTNSLQQYGAVSQAVVEEMAQGGHAENTICIAISGIAGPDGGSREKPVGTVWIAVCLPDGKTHSQMINANGSRAQIRKQAINTAFVMLLQLTVIKGK
ncbi:MAG: nicotinamide-nucleotide amidohydrolase family protein [Mariprofundales bacterium]